MTSLGGSSWLGRSGDTGGGAPPLEQRAWELHLVAELERVPP